MANAKISDLTALTGANVDPLADVLPIVDTSVTTTKKILVSELAKSIKVLGTETASTSGTTIDYTIPAWARRVTVMYVGVSTNGTSNFLIQLGDAGGVETTGYVSSSGNGSGSTTSTAGFIITQSVSASETRGGAVTLTNENSSAFTWVSTGILNREGTGPEFSVGTKSTSQAMTTVRLTTVNGTDAFDAGVVNVLYE